MKKLLSLVIFFAAICFCAAQAPSAPPSHEVVEVANLSEAFAAFLHFLGVSPSGVLLGGLLLKSLAGYWRNFALKGKAAEDVGVMSRAIAHVAGASLPKTDRPEPVSTPAIVAKV